MPTNIFSKNDERLDISGYFLASAGILHFNDIFLSSGTFYLGRTTLRLNFATKYTQLVKFEASLDFNVLFGLYNSFFFHK
ncbi:MAG: hypothetical protein NZ839_01965 [Endomicrobia bacterium]|nr:hypothetical protein [Endomicrobiia bacterium]